MSAAVLKWAGESRPDVERRAWSAVHELRAECRRAGQPLAEVGAALVMGARPTVTVLLGDLPDDVFDALSARVRSILERLPSVARVVAEWRAEREREERDARLPGPLMAAPRATQLESPEEAPRPTAENAPVSDRVIPFESRARAGERERGSSDGRASRPGFAELTEAWAAERVARELRGRFLYVFAWGEWVGFDGKRWKRDAGDAITRAALEVTGELADEIARAATQTSDGGAAASKFRFARGLLSRRVLENVLVLARAFEGMNATADQFDRDPWALNCENGTLDLRTGKLRPHRAEDMFTKLAPVAFDPLAVSDAWERFLDDATAGDEELRAFLQRAAGASVVGDNRDERLFLLLGPAATGKSTFAEAIKTTLGDYASTADFRTFLARRADDHGPRQDLARLQGARVVTSSEVKAGARLAEEVVKTLTGRDVVTARFLYGREFEFKPAFTLWLLANEAPRADAADDAIWRRIVRVPFENVIPEDRRDPAVKAELTDPARSGAALLAWLVAGCLDWQRDGLAIPDSITRATAAYREECDPLAAFWEERCAFEPGATATPSEIARAAGSWCEANNVPPIKSPRTLANLLRAKGAKLERAHQGRRYLGVRVLP